MEWGDAMTKKITMMFSNDASHVSMSWLARVVDPKDEVSRG